MITHTESLTQGLCFLTRFFVGYRPISVTFVLISIIPREREKSNF